MSAFETHVPKLTRDPLRSRSEWRTVIDMVPAGFDLLSLKQVAHQGLDFFSNATDSTRYRSVLSTAEATLRHNGIPILITEHRGARQLLEPEDLKRSQRRWIGQVALQLYFTQLYYSDSAVVDLWPSRLGIDAAGDGIWNPRPIYLRWDPCFLSALRDLYAGFFLGDDQRFRCGIKQLGLGSASELILQHLGEDDQRCVRFRIATLQSMLREISAARTNQDGALHRNFIAFGFYVASLHALLESLGLAFDVRRAFMRAHRGKPESS
jgi:hypothetical protein